MLTWHRDDTHLAPACNRQLFYNHTCIGTLHINSSSTLVVDAKASGLSNAAIVHGSVVLEPGASVSMRNVSLANDVDPLLLLYITHALLIAPHTPLDLYLDDNIALSRADYRCRWQVRVGHVRRRDTHQFRARLMLRNGSTRALAIDVDQTTRVISPIYFTTLSLTLK
jgi:hypothetical protein